MTESLVNKLKEAFSEGNADLAAETTQKLLECGVSPDEVMRVMMETMQDVGDRFDRNELFLPDLILAGESLRASINVLKPLLEKGGGQYSGTVVLGSVEGDVHDIGKSIVESVLIGAGYKVIDLGVDVPAEMFAAKAKEVGANIVGASAYMSTTTAQLPKVNIALKEAGIRDKVKLIIGGAATSESHVKWCGADGWSETATGVIPVLKELGC